MNLTRRKFLKISAGTIAAAAAVSQFNGVVKGSEKIIAEQKRGIKKIPTFCDICFWKCGAIAYLKKW